MMMFNGYPTNILSLMEEEKKKAAIGTPTPQSKYTTADPFNLASLTNPFMTQQALAQYSANMPGFMQNRQQQASVIGSQLKGQVATDVLNQIIQRGAERGIIGGSSGGPGANSAWMKLLGQTSMGLQQQGMQNMSQMIQDTPTAELFNPASLFVGERMAEKELAAYQGNRTPTTIGGVTTMPAAWAPNYNAFSI